MVELILCNPDYKSLHNRDESFKQNQSARERERDDSMGLILCPNRTYPDVK